MEDLFVKYNSSLELRKLGYNEPCFGYYEPNKDLDYIEKHILKDFPYLAKNSEWQDLVAAPTYEQAIDWLLKTINEGKSFGNERGYRYDGTYFSLTWGGMTMKVTTSKEEVVIELIKILKGEDE